MFVRLPVLMRVVVTVMMMVVVMVVVHQFWRRSIRRSKRFLSLSPRLWLMYSMSNFELFCTTCMDFPRGLEVGSLRKSVGKGFDDGLEVFFCAFGRARKGNDDARIANACNWAGHHRN